MSNRRKVRGRRQRRSRSLRAQRRSLALRNRGTIDWSALDGIVGRFDRNSLCGLTAAALDSPGGGHRLPSLAALWIAEVRAAFGADTPSRSDLSQLLVETRGAAPALEFMEDCWLTDPRLIVSWSTRGRRLRIHPGAYTDPLLVLRMADATADAIDELALAAHGFSLSDLVEVALAYGDWRLALLVPHWPEGALARDSWLRSFEELTPARRASRTAEERLSPRTRSRSPRHCEGISGAPPSDLIGHFDNRPLFTLITPSLGASKIHYDGHHGRQRRAR